MLQIGEENTDLALGRSQGIAAVHQILREQDAQVTTDGAGGGVARIGGTHHVADNFPGVFGALKHQGHDIKVTNSP